MLDKLKEVSWNWFAFVILLGQELKDQGYSEAVFDQFFIDFAAQLPELRLSEEEVRLTEHSRMVYFEKLHEKEADVGRFSDSSTDSSDGEQSEETVSSEHRERIKRKLLQIKDKSR